MTPEQLAQASYESYERLALQYGFATRSETIKPWSEVPNLTKQLMIAVCAEMLVRVNGEPNNPSLRQFVGKVYLRGVEGSGLLFYAADGTRYILQLTEVQYGAIEPDVGKDVRLVLYGELVNDPNSYLQTIKVNSVHDSYV